VVPADRWFWRVCGNCGGAYDGELKVEGASEPFQPPKSGTAISVEPLEPTETADPYGATVERLFVLLEENRIATATLAHAWRHMRRALELTQAELSRAQDALATDRGIDRQSA
jgi:hypothetical protein